MKKVTLFFYCIVLFNVTFGQVSLGDSTRSVSPQGLFDKIFDEFGNVYRIENLKAKQNHKNFSAPSPSTQLTPQREVSYPTCQSGYFNLYFEDGSGFELENDAIHIQRREVLCQLFFDLSNFINSPLTTTLKKVNILIRNIEPINTNPNLAGTASAFYVAPDNPNINLSGIIDNEIWKTINSGKDSYTGVFNPLNILNESTAGNNLYHGWMAFNFNPQSFQWHYDLSTLAPNGNMDLYTIALHEITHALGITSLIYQDGTSRFGSDLLYYSRYDKSLKTNDLLNNLIINSSNCSMYNYSFNSSLNPPSNILSPSCQSGFDMDNTACSNAIKYSNSVDIPVFTPDCFMEGSSLSHFEDQCHPIVEPSNNNKYFAMSNSYNLLTSENNTKRFYQEEERMVLCDLGYNVNLTFGDVTGSVVFNNYKVYNQACTNGAVVGINDGVSSSGTYTYFTNSSGVGSISSFLSNDYSGDGTPIVGFECLEGVYSPQNNFGTISTSSGSTTTSVSLVLNDEGLHLLRYIPISASGTRGNITYIYVYYEGACEENSTCNLIPDNGFELSSYHTTCGPGDYISGTTNRRIHLYCWNTFLNSPDVFDRACISGINQPFFELGKNLWFSETPTDSYNVLDPSISNNRFLGIVNANTTDNPHYTEAVATRLSTPLVIGQTYRLKFWAKNILNHTANQTNNISTGTYSPTEPLFLNFNSMPADPIITQNGIETSISDFYPSSIQLTPAINIFLDDEWHEYEEIFTFNIPSGYTFNTNHNRLIISGHDQVTFGVSNYVVFDDLSITPINQLPEFNLPDVICSGDALDNLANYLSFTFPQGVFTGVGVSESNGIYTFNSAGLTNQNITITYSYIDNNGCSNVVNDQIVINVASTVSDYIICEGQEVLIYPIGEEPFTLQPDNLTSMGEPFILRPTITQTYVLTSNNNLGCSPNFQNITITVNTLPTISLSSVPDASDLCDNQTISLIASGGTDYSWSAEINNVVVNNVFTPNNFEATVSTNFNNTSIYTVYALDANNCRGIASKTITKLSSSTPSISISANDSQYCLDETATFTSAITNGGTSPTYQWKVNNIDVVGETNATFSSNSLQSGDVVSCVLTSSNICVTSPMVSSNNITFNISAGPTLIITASDAILCAGESTTLTVSGADTYEWSSGETSTSVTVTPTSTGSYSVTGTQAGGCSSTESISITINPLPVITFSPENPTTCAGTPITILAVGSTLETNFTWTGFLAGSNPISVNPTTSTTYTVTGTDLNACVKSESILVTVNPTPIINVVASSNSICIGDQVSLAANGNASSYVWDNGYGSSSTITVSPNINTTYVVTGYLGACSSEAFIEVMVEDCACSTVNTNLTLINNPTSEMNKIIYVSGSVEITNNVTFENCELRFAPNASIIIADGLTIFKGCHLYACGNQMWNGIVVTKRGKLSLVPILTSDRIRVLKTTLIEDAKIGVRIYGIIEFNTMIKTLVATQNTFNKNHVDIQIEDFEWPGIKTENSDFFDISNNVFTCRNIPFTPATINDLSSFVWPKTTQLKAYNSLSGMNPPYIPNASFSPDVNATLKAPYQGQKTFAGIKLIYVGRLYGNFPNYSHSYITIGNNTAGHFNLFDNMHFGIYADNSNLIVRNNVFQNILRFNRFSGAGVYTESISGDIRTNRRNTLELPAGLTNGGANNRFYNCSNAVLANSNWLVKIDKILVKNNYTDNTPRNGVSVRSAFFDLISVENSEFYNVFNATAVYHHGNDGNIRGIFGLPISQVNGTITINKNKYFDNGGENMAGRIIRNAIIISNTSANSGFGLAGRTIQVNENKMTDVFRGIEVKNWMQKPLFIQNNEAKLVQETGSSLQFGIASKNNIGNFFTGFNVIDNNIVEGYDADSDPLQIAIYSSMSPNQRVTCNYVSNSFHGIKFDGWNTGTRFEKNDMTNHTNGFTLDWTGIIGDQGRTSPTTGYRTDNRWLGANWNGTHFKSMTMNGSSATASKIFVGSAPNLDPTGVTTLVDGTDNYYYNTTNPAAGTILQTNAPNPNPTCNSDQGNTGTGNGTGTGVLSGGSGSVLLLEQIALNELEYTHNPEQTQVINEHKLFKMLEREPDLRTQSAILENFYQNNLTTNKKKVSETENYIAVGELSSASSEVSTIIDDNEVDFTYKLYYEWYLNQTWDSLPSTSDSTFLMDLANSCPFTKGEIVYQARALFQSIYNYSEAFIDNCENKRGGGNYSIRQGENNKEEQIANSTLTIFPNPTNGNIYFNKFGKDEVPYLIKIVDLTGKLIFEKELVLGVEIKSINIEVSSGVYKIELINNVTNEKTNHKIHIIH